MEYQVYVIRDNGIEESSLPFYAQNDVGAKRQFVAQLRMLPPSVRGEYDLMHVGSYDTDLCYHTSTPGNIVVNGAHKDIFATCQEDEAFFRARVENLATKGADTK